MTYQEHFKKNYKELLTGFDNDSLVKHEEDLREFIDSESARGFVLSDEIHILYELIRDECVRRVARLVPFDT